MIFHIESSISRSSRNSSTIHPKPTAPPLPPKTLVGWPCQKKRASDDTDVFQGPKMVFFPSMNDITTTKTQRTKHDDNNNNNSNNNDNLTQAENTINKPFIKLKLSRAPSRSLDSLHRTMLDSNVSRLFSEMTIDELFPKIVEDTFVKK